MLFGRPDRGFRWESLGFWGETVRAWRQQGLPEDWSPEAYFEFDPFADLPVASGFTVTPYSPPFEHQVLAEDDFSITYRSNQGILLRERKEKPELSMPQFLDFPVKAPEDFEALLWRLDPSDPDRLPQDFHQRLPEWRQRDYPLFLRICGAFGHPRNLLGLERLLVTYYDDPQFVHRILDHWAGFYEALFDRVLSQVTVDLLMIWEDMCYKAGPLIGPALFREFMLPYYHRVIDCARQFGVPIIMVDTDGNFWDLLPLFLEAGVNMMMPFEIAASMEPLEVRKQVGKRLAILGGIDKRALRADKRAVEAEVERKVPPLVAQGGFIPCLDHTAPPDIPFENFAHLVRCLRRYTEP